MNWIIHVAGCLILSGLAWVFFIWWATDDKGSEK